MDEEREVSISRIINVILNNMETFKRKKERIMGQMIKRKKQIKVYKKKQMKNVINIRIERSSDKQFFL